MFNGGIVTVFVTDMDRSVRFYTEQLGLKLLQRYQNHFATIDAGHGLTIGLHPASAASPAGERKGGMSIGLVSDRCDQGVREDARIARHHLRRRDHRRG